MQQIKNGNPWYFGMQVQVGADLHAGVAHTVSVTQAKASDIGQLPNWLREDDQMVSATRARSMTPTSALRGKRM